MIDGRHDPSNPQTDAFFVACRMLREKFRNLPEKVGFLCKSSTKIPFFKVIEISRKLILLLLLTFMEN